MASVPTKEGGTCKSMLLCGFNKSLRLINQEAIVESPLGSQPV